MRTDADSISVEHFMITKIMVLLTVALLASFAALSIRDYIWYMHYRYKLVAIMRYAMSLAAIDIVISVYVGFMIVPSIIVFSAASILLYVYQRNYIFVKKE